MKGHTSKPVWTVWRRLGRRERRQKKEEFRAQTLRVAELLAELDVKGWVAIFREHAELNPDDEFGPPNPVDEYAIEAAEIVRKMRIASARGDLPSVANASRMIAKVFRRSYEEEFSADEFRPIAPKVLALFGSATDRPAG